MIDYLKKKLYNKIFHKNEDIFDNVLHLKKPYKKIYRFDFMEDSVERWQCEHITRDMIGQLPYGLNIWTIPPIDPYGNVVDDFDEWHQQREEYIDYLYKKYKR